MSSFFPEFTFQQLSLFAQNLPSHSLVQRNLDITNLYVTKSSI